jgi:outer membrane protein OmpA-like peptidoglycan-associated protein
MKHPKNKMIEWNILMVRIMLIFVILSINIFAQDNSQSENRSKYGAFVDYNLNQHKANFQEIPGFPNCCLHFETGTGTGISAGLLYSTPITSFMSSQFRLAYSSLNGKLTATEPVMLNVNGLPQWGEFEHIIDAKLSTISLQPVLSFHLFGDLSIHAGIDLGYLLQKSFEQMEKVTKPDGYVTFLDSLGQDSKSRIRNQRNGDITGYNSIQLSTLAGISYEFTLNSEGTLFLVPEIFYNYGFTNFAENIDWKVSNIRAGLALIYSPKNAIALPVEEIREHIDKIDTVKSLAKYHGTSDSVAIGTGKISTETQSIENKRYITEIYTRTDTLFVAIRPELRADISAYGVRSDGTEIPSPNFVIEEFPYLQLVPLLNYVFFDDNSSDIQSKYVRLPKNETEKFNENKLYHYGTLKTYYHILNIIGSRLRANPQASITITGCNSDQEAEKNNKELSMKRAMAVRNYLKDVWDIQESRMQVVARNLPLKLSSPAIEADNIQENRRVEISSNDYEILKPVFTADTLRTVNPPILRFKLEARAEAGFSKWAISTKQVDKALTSFSDNGIPAMQLDWKFDSDQENIPRLEEPLEYSLAVWDKAGQSYKSPEKQISIEQITIRKKENAKQVDKTIDRYSLILFDFDKSELTQDNAKFIKTIRKRLKPTSSIFVYGYTDRTGDAIYNKTLSERRAQSTARALGQKSQVIIGVGEDKQILDNDIPEGRFYSRTVEITVETPIER